MPVSPTQKQDLMLVKEAFEKKALEQDTAGAQRLPMVTTVQQARRIHEVIRDEATTYPAANAKQKTAKDDPSFLKQKQIECIPCLGRIRSLKDLDMAGDLFSTMLAYNDRALKNMLQLFKSVSRPNYIQENLCGAYHALRSQCIPDITRLITQLTLLLNNLRGFNLKSLKDQLIGLVGALIVRSLVFGAINYDMYVGLITDVTRCIATDINTQLGKLEPILSREGLEDIANLLPLDTQDGELTRDEAARAKAANWFPDQGDFNYAKDASKAVNNAEQVAADTLNTFNRGAGQGVDRAANIGRLIKDMIEESISVVDDKLQNATQELLKFLKLSDGNLSAQIEIMDQVQLVQSVLEVLKTIQKTRSNFDPCGEDAGRRFFNRIKFPGQDINVEDPDHADGPTVTIVPPTIRIKNPVVEDILNENGIETGPVKSGRVIKSVPIMVNVSKCLDGKQ